ncbi:MAG: DUF5668 domain-containing protein [Bacteroidota bacterium]
MNRKHFDDIFWGAILIVIGGLFLARNLGYIDFSFSLHRYWPVLLIVIGISIVLKSLMGNKTS